MNHTISKIEVVKFLIDELESEIKYNEKYTPREPLRYNRLPRKSIIEANCMKIRQLIMQISKEEEN